LKRSVREILILARRVAPRRGAWIETLNKVCEPILPGESHPAGVRGLKLARRSYRQNRHESHPAGVRGLKHETNVYANRAIPVAPRRGAWIETSTSANTITTGKSHPAGVRGLKLVIVKQLPGIGQSHPAGVRGLKLNTLRRIFEIVKVAPRRGAWIETSVVCLHGAGSTKSHPAGVRGLKHVKNFIFVHVVSCRTPQGCVD